MNKEIESGLKSLIMEAIEEVMDECGMSMPAEAPVNEEEVPAETPIEEACKEECNEASLRNAKALMVRMGCNLNESKHSHKSLMMEHYQSSHRG